MKIRTTKDVNPYWKRDGYVSPEDYFVRNNKGLLRLILMRGDTDHPKYRIAQEAEELGLLTTTNE